MERDYASAYTLRKKKVSAPLATYLHEHQPRPKINSLSTKANQSFWFIRLNLCCTSIALHLMDEIQGLFCCDDTDSAVSVSTNRANHPVKGIFSPPHHHHQIYKLVKRCISALAVEKKNVKNAELCWCYCFLNCSPKCSGRLCEKSYFPSLWSLCNQGRKTKKKKGWGLSREGEICTLAMELAF